MAASHLNCGMWDLSLRHTGSRVVVYAGSEAFRPGCAPACGISVPQSRTEPKSPALQGWFLSHWTTREVPQHFLKSSVYRQLFSTFLLFSCFVVSDSLRPHGLQHARLLCPSLSPGVCSNSYPLSQWCHLTIPSSVALFSFCLQS